jgi:hypothetical protein
MKRNPFIIISILVLVFLLGMSTVYADNDFLPNNGDLPVIRAVYEGGGTIYQGDRVTLYSDYYLPRALESNEKVVFQWYESDVNSTVYGDEIDHQMGNNFIVDTSRIGTYYYYYTINYLKNNEIIETVTSDPIGVTVEERVATANPLSTLLTPAEASGWRRTTSSAEVVEFCETVAGHSEGRIKMFNMGYTAGGKEMPLLIMSYPEAPESPNEVDPDKAVVLVNCNIHSGEVEGKEAMLIFAREVALGQHDELLEDLVVLLIPNSNADGNDMLGKRRISTQYTPKLVGTRFTGAMINPYLEILGIEDQYNYNSETHNFYNMNRDMTKLDTVEARAIVNVMNEWDPVLFVDAHATNGSYMRHAITYNWGLHPNTDPDIMEYNRDVFCRNAVGEDSYLFEVQGKVAVPYGNFSGNRVHTDWTTFEDYPRYTTNYAGLRNRLALLLEVYSHDPYTVRVDTQYACIYGSLLAVQEDKEHIKELIAQADERSLARAVNGSAPTEKVALNSTLEYLCDLNILGYKADPDNDNRVISFNMIDDEGDRCGTLFAGEADYVVPYNGKFVPSGEETMGAYYLIDRDCVEVIQLLDYHGIEYTRLSAPMTIPAGEFQWYNIEKRNQSPEPTSSGTLRNLYEGHLMNRFSGSWVVAESAQTFPAGTYVVSTAQSRGSLAALLLEPACVDGAVSWNFFDNRFNVDDPQTVRSNFACTTTDATPLTIGMPIFKVVVFDEAEKPVITQQPQDQVVYTNANPTLSVQANVTDGGTLSYQWYRNSTRSNQGGEAIEGATDAIYAPPTSSVGTVYYYVVVTNTSINHIGNKVAQTVSDVAELVVNRRSSSSSSSKDTEYSVNLKTTVNGIIKADKTKATAGSKVNITVTANPGYEVDEIIVKDSTGKKIALTKNSDGTYSFIMPSSTATVDVTFKEIASTLPTEPGTTMPFNDVRSGDWFYQAVQFVFSKDLFKGTSETTFSPNGNMTRGMLVTVLWRLAGSPDTSEAGVFNDVIPGAYYEKAAVWAAGNSIVSGYSSGQIAPNDNATREQMAVILYNFAKFMGYDVSATVGLESFVDGENTSSWAAEAMQWAVAVGLIGGKGNGMLDPTGNVTRAEVAAILMRFMENVVR